MTSKTTFYFSRTLNRKFYSPDGKSLGKVKDLLIELNGSRPKVIAVKAKINRKLRILDFAQFDLVKAVTHYVIKCNDIIDYNIPENSHSFFLAESVLDRQIVDINGRKLVRVNDIRLVIIPDGVYVIAVDVGLEGLLRRIGISHQIKTFLSRINLTLPSRYILWDDFETIDTMRAGIRLSTSYSKLHTLHPSDLADIIEYLGKASKTHIFSSLDEEKAADVLEELEPHEQVHIIESLSLEKAADVLEKMPANEAADVLDVLEEEKAEQLLKEMEKESSKEVRELLEYPNTTVGSIMTTDVLSFSENITIDEALKEIRHQKPDMEVLYNLFVIDEQEKLIATVSLRDLVISEPDILINKIMKTNPVSVYDDDKLDSLAEIASKYNLLAIPVTNNENKLEGMVVIDDIVEDLVGKGRTK